MKPISAPDAASRVRALRQELGLTQSQLAARIGASPLVPACASPWIEDVPWMEAIACPDDFNPEAVGPEASHPDAASRIRVLRQKLGLTQRQLAEHVGVTSVTISRWERGLNEPHPLTWEKVQLLEEGLEETSRRRAGAEAAPGGEAGPDQAASQKQKTSQKAAAADLRPDEIQRLGGAVAALAGAAAAYGLRVHLRVEAGAGSPLPDGAVGRVNELLRSVSGKLRL